MAPSCFFSTLVSLSAFSTSHIMWTCLSYASVFLICLCHSGLLLPFCFLALENKYNIYTHVNSFYLSVQSQGASVYLEVSRLSFFKAEKYSIILYKEQLLSLSNCLEIKLHLFKWYIKKTLYVHTPSDMFHLFLLKTFKILSSRFLNLLQWCTVCLLFLTSFT